MSNKLMAAVIVIAIVGIGAVAFFAVSGGFGSNMNGSGNGQFENDDIDTKPVVPDKTYAVDHLKENPTVGDYITVEQSYRCILEDYGYQWLSHLPELSLSIDEISKVGSTEIVCSGKKVKCDTYTLAGSLAYIVPGSNFRMGTEFTNDAGQKEITVIVETDIDYMKGGKGIKPGNYLVENHTVDGKLLETKRYTVVSVDEGNISADIVETVQAEQLTLKVTSVGDDEIKYSHTDVCFFNMTDQVFMNNISFKLISDYYKQLQERRQNGDTSVIIVEHTVEDATVMDTPFGERKVTKNIYSIKGNSFEYERVFYVGEDQVIYAYAYESEQMSNLITLQSTSMFL